jgi:hypothetical protein
LNVAHELNPLRTKAGRPASLIGASTLSLLNAAFRDRLMWDPKEMVDVGESGHRRMYQDGKTDQRRGVAA